MGTIKVDEAWNVGGRYRCPICSEEYGKSGISSHIWRKHTEEGSKHWTKTNYAYREGRVIWNKGLTKESDDRVKKFSDTLKKAHSDGVLIPWMLGRKHTPTTLAKLKANGGVRKGSGRGKSGWYKGYWCDSSWELAWVIYQLEHGEVPIRNAIGFTYDYNGGIHKYYPDFILNDIYYEIKGYQRENDKYKFMSFPHKLIILTQIEMHDIIQYVINAYGKDYIRLYDSRPKSKEKIKSNALHNSYVCSGCKCTFSAETKRKYCSPRCRELTRGSKIPTYDQLVEDVNSMCMVKVGKKYGVSDNAVRKWCKRYGIEYRKYKK